MRRLLSCLARLIVLTSVCLSTPTISQISPPGKASVELLTEIPETSSVTQPAPPAPVVISTPDNNSVPDYARYKGVTQQMWNRIAEIGDPLNCEAKIEEISTSVTQQTLSPCNGNCINDALAANNVVELRGGEYNICLLYTSPSPRDKRQSRMPSSA